MPKILILVFLFSVSIEAQDTSLFRKGQLFMDFSYGAGKPQSAILEEITDPTDYRLDSLRLALSSNQQKQILGLARMQAYQEPRIRSTTARFSLEYAVLDWLGLGFSLNSQKLKLSRVYVGPLMPVEFYTLPFASSSCEGFVNISSSCGPGLLDYLASATFGLISEPIHTADFEVGFHPVSGSVDPYFKLAMGGGVWEKNTVARGSAILGCRVRTTQWLYLFAEGYAAHYSIQARRGGGSATGQDSGGRAGIGFTF